MVDAADALVAVAGRTCGGCTECCRLLAVEELNKPANTICVHCAPGSGCLIYDTRPGTCRRFMCAWLTQAEVGDHWRPGNCKMVLQPDRASATLVVHVDPEFHQAWRDTPYQDDLRAWAAAGVAGCKLVLVKVGDDFTVVFPNGDKLLGPMLPGLMLLVQQSESALWTEYDAELVEATDAAAAGAIAPPGVSM
jgi:hypothetical protein